MSGIFHKSDFNGNILEETQSIVYYKDDIIASVSSKYDIIKAAKLLPRNTNSFCF